MTRFFRPPVLCGCWYMLPNHSTQKKYLPQIELDSKTTILSCTARTQLVQTFTNVENSSIPEAQYTFPLYDGVTVVSFRCTVGSRTIYGVVKEKQQARADYQEAVDKGQTASLLEQFEEAGDIFTTKIGNILAGEKVIIEIVYLGELKHDAEKDGIRFTIPTAIAPRYGSMSNDSHQSMYGLNTVFKTNGMKILVDVATEKGSAIRGVQSPSHPIAVTLGRNSTQDEDIFQNNLASATLALSGKTELDQDFVIVVNAQGQDTPRAIYETHDALQNQRALMTTLVPKFNLPNASPEIVFVVDRSGSMGGKIPLVVQALRIFLKSLPTSAKFNICSFGSQHTFLFKKSKPYDESSLNEALQHLDSFDANYGGTEMLTPIKQCVKQRLNGTSLEIMLLTDGEIWNQDEMFKFVNDAAKDKVRVFSLGIGSGASSSLVEGLARAGNGFSQFVYDGEQIDKRVVRMLKAALMPFISDYSLEVVYGPEEDGDDFTLVESFTESMKSIAEETETGCKKEGIKKAISLFSKTFKEDKPSEGPKGRYDHLPSIAVPTILQAPFKIPQLYPFTRTTIYLLFGPESCQRRPQKVMLRGTSEHGPLELEIPVQDVGKGQMVHQLAAKKAIQELEEGRGWISEAALPDNQLLKKKYEGDWERIVERETVRIGTRYQVAGKFCSFVAVEANSDSENMDSTMELKSDQHAENASQNPASWIQAQSAQQAQYSGIPMRMSQSVAKRGASKEKARKMSRSSVKSGGLFGSPGLSFGAAPAPPAPSGGSLFAFRDRDRRRSASPSASNMDAALAPAMFGSSAAVAPGAPPPPPAPPSAKAPVFQNYDPTIEDSSETFEYTSRSSSAAFANNGLASKKEASSQIWENEDEGMAVETSESAMHALIGLQEFDGSWRKVSDLLTLTEIEQRVFASALGTVQSDVIKATALALAWFQVKASSEKDTWEMVAEKAQLWISGQGVADVEALVKLAKETFFA